MQNLEIWWEWKLKYRTKKQKQNNNQNKETKDKTENKARKTKQANWNTILVNTILLEWEIGAKKKEIMSKTKIGPT